jgi:lysophospholipase L1-like esterase
MALIFKARQTIEFIGDSITDFYRTSPEFAPLGSGYVHAVHTLLQAGYPELQLTVFNKGISGNRITNLESRWQEDVLDVHPDWLFIYIGVNDVWRKFEGDPSEAVSLPDFTTIYHRLIKSAQKNTQAQIRLISPFLAEANPEDPFRMELSLYQTAIDEIGEEHTLPVIHLQPAYDWAMLSKPSVYWTVDRVHPTEIGNMLIALTVLRACGFSL